MKVICDHAKDCTRLVCNHRIPHEFEKDYCKAGPCDSMELLKVECVPIVEDWDK